MESMIIIAVLVVFVVFLWNAEQIWNWIFAKTRNMFKKNTNKGDEFSIKGVDDKDGFLKWLNEQDKNPEVDIIICAEEEYLRDMGNEMKSMETICGLQPQPMMPNNTKKPAKKTAKKVAKKAVKKVSKKTK